MTEAINSGEKEYLVPATSTTITTGESPASSSSSHESTFELEPFIHQVGGRSAILVLGGYICKPVNARELAFYETLDRWGPQLKPFVPHYNGVIAVNFTENNDGYLNITTKSSSLHQAPADGSSSAAVNTNTNTNNNNSLTANSPHGSSSSSHHHQIKSCDSNSPYQKFVTKYRIKLVRPLREIIIESHEQDVENDVALDLESSKRQLEHLLLNRSAANSAGSSAVGGGGGGQQAIFERSYSVGGMGVTGTGTANVSSSSTSNLSRSRSTSISIPNFEDGNFFNQTDLSTLFDNPFFAYTTTTTESAGQSVNGFSSRHHSGSSRVTSPPPPPLSFQTRQSPSVTSSPSRSAPPAKSSSSSLLQVGSSNKSTTKHNPWVLKTFSALSEFNDSMKEQRFIMLENLVANFEYPCIIDLKMGTRLHDDNATETKKQSHESKVNETTSGALGLRITGIQIYDTSLDRFICYNKYYGRKLTPEGFRASLKQFVSNENFVAHNLLEVLIDRLKALRAVITTLETFRFYTSSLLLIYEGNSCGSKQKPPSEDVLASAAEHHQPSESSHCCHHDTDKLIDVRVIDFAHSTHQHIENGGSSLPPVSAETNAASKVATSNDGDVTSTASPPTEQNEQQQHDYDEGFVFGLDNLIKIFTMFKNEPKDA